MRYRVEFRPYARSFKIPLRTHHGWWNVRKGIILRLSDGSGRVGWGEIAPVAAFGSESFEAALRLCQQLSSAPAIDPCRQIPDHYPACRFGFESAWEGLTGTQTVDDRDRPAPIYSQLLPTGTAALTAWQPFWAKGNRTFKWKIGVAELAQELAVFAQLIEMLPTGVCLRLDANGGLDHQSAARWLQVCDACGRVEFLEQPLPPSQFESMLALSQRYRTPIALDESIATLDQLETCGRQGWRGVCVVKPAIAGSPQRLRQIGQQYPLDLVWSSVFETAIARHFILNALIPSLPPSSRALGFGVNHWFTDSQLDQSNFEQLWQTLSPFSASAPMNPG